MKLTLICEHGTRTVEVDDGREGPGASDYVRERIAALTPRCPYCDWRGTWTPLGEIEAVSNDSLIALLDELDAQLWTREPIPSPPQLAARRLLEKLGRRPQA